MYSGVSGANFNYAISFALWLTGKLSNRKLVLYILAQLAGCVVSMGLVALSFPNSGDLWKMFALDSGDLGTGDLIKLFFKEFIATFILSYTVFHIAFEDQGLFT